MDKAKMRKTANYDKYPFVEVESVNTSCFTGWEAVCRQLNHHISSAQKNIIVIECYQGVFDDELILNFKKGLKYDNWFDAKEAYKNEEDILAMTYPFVTDDRTFGYLSSLNISDFLDQGKLSTLQKKIQHAAGTSIVYGSGSGLIVPENGLLIYADMARWEIQRRMRKNGAANVGISNSTEDFSLQYKRGYFVDWRACDRLKKTLMHQWDYVLDSNKPGIPNLVKGKAILKGLNIAAKRPFRVVPFFDPGPWGGQWMKEVFGLDPSVVNYAWCFDCVPEENSLLLRFGHTDVEIPAINLVFYEAVNILGPKVYARFGDEFPIRFDILDTLQGGNLSLQVHPLAGYIKEKFGMPYTQDESYYFLEAGREAVVYLGLQEGVKPEEMLDDLRLAEQGEKIFNDEKFISKWPVKKHDHVSIPAGTVHCSGEGAVVLEISATPYIFTFKLWDWGHLGMDGEPRPINIEHAEEVIQWNRTAPWVKKHVLNGVEELGSGEGWREERTGLNELEFIETRRHWFTRKVWHHTGGIVNVLNLVKGSEVIVESPTGAFEPYVIHYAETFIVPAAVNEYTIRPHGKAEGMECATIKAYIRV